MGLGWVGLVAAFLVGGTFVCWGEEGLRWEEEKVEEEGVG